MGLSFVHFSKLTNRTTFTPLSVLYNSATVEELCKRGYKVRAATRDISKTTLFAEKLNKLYGEGLFEAVAVPDFTIENAYDAHLEGELLFHVIFQIAISLEYLTGR